MPWATNLTAMVERLASRDDPTRTEADVQAELRTLLLYGGLNLQDPQIRLESPAPNRRRIDIEIGSTVIEVKKDLRVGNVRADGITQLQGYVAQRTNDLGRRYVGVLTDGADWRVYHLNSSSHLEEVASLLLTASSPDVDSLYVWLESLLATAQQVRPTHDEIENKLGATSPSFKLDVSDLTALYEAHSGDPGVAMKRELWARLLYAALGTNFTNDDSLFIEHTYLVISAELIAHAVVGYSIEDPALVASDLVSGALFRTAGITGVVEPDFFDWPVEVPGGDRFVRTLARRLARFDWSNVEHDVLKVLYESVIDVATRKRLGEYYTPDWLAEHTVDAVVDAPLQQRVLDPACGSGTFLFWTLRRYLAASDAAGVAPADSIDGAVAHVFGIDLHPVAVTLARVTYLLAFGTQRLQQRRSFGVPVYLGDSIQLAQDTSTLTPTGVTIFTSEDLNLFSQALFFPDEVVADAASFDSLVGELADKAATRLAGSGVPSIDAILDRWNVPTTSRSDVAASFAVLCDLHDNSRDHIWGYYIRNMTRPLEFTRAANRVDRLVGNPPWLAARFMNQSMRDTFTRMSRERGILSGHHAQRELAGLFVARAVELYLKAAGKFGFVMPRAALSRGQYEGFRTGQFSSPNAVVNVRFDEVWDFAEVTPSPFPVPCCVLLGQSDTQATAVPTDATAFDGSVGASPSGWAAASANLTSSTVNVQVATLEWKSVYGDRFRTGAPLYPRILMFVEPAPTPPIGIQTGRRMVRSRRTAQEKAPWKNLPPLQGPVEIDAVVPVHMGETVLPYRTLSSLEVVLPLHNYKLISGSDSVIDQRPGLAAWWRAAEAVWDANAPATNQLSLVEKINYVSSLAVQLPVASKRVVYTKAGNRLAAARLTDDPAIVENGLYWAEVNSDDEALYLEAIFNCERLGDLVRPYQATGLFGARHFDKYIFVLPIPEFDSDNPLHTTLAGLAKQAEAIAAGATIPPGTGFQRARSLVRAELVAAGVAAQIETAVTSLIVV